MNFFIAVGSGPRTNRLGFGGDLDHNPDPFHGSWIRIRIRRQEFLMYSLLNFWRGEAWPRKQSTRFFGVPDDNPDPGIF